ncbi:MAG: hypothetical protein E6J16_08505 [Chloroflexota bacterium]|nr:MAG: hypothetical protein E6J16_08505 [Chloroflexota bacterium]
MARAIDQVEDGIYIVVAVLLVVAGLFALWGAVNRLVSDVQHNNQAVAVVTDLLDNGLILFIIAELLHTVRVTIQERPLVVEPFLIVALIAGVRSRSPLSSGIASISSPPPASKVASRISGPGKF